MWALPAGEVVARAVIPLQGGVVGVGGGTQFGIGRCPGETVQRPVVEAVGVGTLDVDDVVESACLFSKRKGNQV